MTGVFSIRSVSCVVLCKHFLVMHLHPLYYEDFVCGEGETLSTCQPVIVRFIRRVLDRIDTLVARTGPTRPASFMAFRLGWTGLDIIHTCMYVATNRPCMLQIHINPTEEELRTHLRSR